MDSAGGSGEVQEQTACCAMLHDSPLFVIMCIFTCVRVCALCVCVRVCVCKCIDIFTSMFIDVKLRALSYSVTLLSVECCACVRVSYTCV